MKDGNSCQVSPGFKEEFGARNLFNLILSFALSIYMLLGFYSIIYSFRRLDRPGMSRKMRRLFISKHRNYVVALLVLWLF